MKVDAGYERADHLFRTRDHYAIGKYHITCRWLPVSDRPERLLLNIGCGAGDFNQFARELKYRVQAYEPEKGTFLEAQKKFGDLPWCQLSNKGILEINPAETRSASCAVMHDVLEHIEDDEAAVRHLAALLPIGAQLVISVPALQVLFGAHDRALGHYRRYTKRQLLARLRPYFQVKQARYYGFLFIPITLLFSVILKHPYPQPGEKETLMGRVVKMLCWIEERINPPLGTSVLALVERKAD